MKTISRSIMACVALGAFGLMPATSVDAAIIAAGDTYVEIGDLFNPNAPTATRNTQTFFSVRDGNPNSNSDRVGVLYFDLSSVADTGASDGSSLSLTLGQDVTTPVGSVDDPVVLNLWAVADNVAEDNYTDASYAVINNNSLLNAIDNTSDRVRNGNLFQSSPIASISYPGTLPTIANGPIVFSGSGLDTFISSVTDGTDIGADNDIAFLITAVSNAGGSTSEFRFLSTESGASVAPVLDVVVPEPASLVLVGLGGLAMVARRRQA